MLGVHNPHDRRRMGSLALGATCAGEGESNETEERKPAASAPDFHASACLSPCEQNRDVVGAVDEFSSLSVVQPDPEAGAIGHVFVDDRPGDRWSGAR